MYIDPMNRPPWIALGATALFTGLTGSGRVSVYPAGSVGMAPQAVPGRTLAAASPASINNAGANLTTRVVWLDQEPIMLKYVPGSGQSADGAKLRGTLGLRKVGPNEHEHVTLSLFRIQTDSVLRDDIGLEMPSSIDLRDDKPKVVDVVLGTQAHCVFQATSFDYWFLLTSLKRPDNCFPMTGYIFAENTPILSASEDDLKSQHLEAEQTVLSWIATLPFSFDLERQIMGGAAVWAAGIVALVLIISCIRGSPPWSVMAGTPNWDFSSWAANIALGGGLLNALITFATLNPVVLNKSTCSFLALWATALLAIGPMLYAAFSWTKQTSNGSVMYSPVRFFFAASFLVLWAALMQLRLVRVLLAELYLDKTITGQIESWTSGAVAVIASVLVVYAIFSLVRTAGKQDSKRPLKEGAEAPTAHRSLL